LYLKEYINDARSHERQKYATNFQPHRPNRSPPLEPVQIKLHHLLSPKRAIVQKN